MKIQSSGGTCRSLVSSISKLGFRKELREQGSLDRQGMLPEKLWEESLYRIFQLGGG